MNLKTIKNIKNLQNKRVVLRVDFNVPMKKNKITDDSRIKKSLKTIKYLIKNKAKIIIISHLGRPDGKIDKTLSLKPIKLHLEKLLNKKIQFETNFDFKNLEEKSKNLKASEILLLENIRFLKGEESNSITLSKNLAKLGDIFINDAFGTAHRKHSSTVAITKYLKSYAGYLMETEVKELGKVIEKTPKRPITMIFGGAKIDTKIGIIKNFINKTDTILIGGAIANTFLKALGYDIGESLVENNKIKVAQKIMQEFKNKRKKLILPKDVVVTNKIDSNSKIKNISIKDVNGNMKIIDIGKESAHEYAEIIKNSKTIILNGPMGIYEIKNFSKGTKIILQALKDNKNTTILGGGDTVDAIIKLGFKETDFHHVSSGGGASIEFLEGKILVGIKPLLK